MRKQHIIITEAENTVLCEIKKQSLTLTELETACSNLNKKIVQSSVYSLINKGLIELSNDFKILPCASEFSVVKIQPKPRLVHIENGFNWHSDNVLSWAFGQLEEFATYGNFDSIGLAVRFSDRNSYATFEGDDLIGLAGTVSLLHTSIINYCREED